ncbi:3-dehydroquinate synthase [Anaeromicropila herbilytica]|uniref:3-dehydroquinate synthase n=1 Tax=Anaeromicropila herbilytica TaxID=2785025 RepID=A0A7R7IEK3_9FIRM|nr:3-dehydroquinate synthase [Anaeromicropila herbilytica]BCN31193.1 3-dehydroquinate synthase [Anaeromicropila herbilytica]
MGYKINVHYEEKPCYDIIIKESYDYLIDELNKLDIKNRKLCIVSDSTVGKYYLEELSDRIKESTSIIESFVFQAGEENKNLNTVQNVYEYLIEKQFDRNDILVALGGGVVGDLTGFAAATYLRGIRFVQVPTSLLSMVDSSIGGKTGVDFNAYKNMVGAFHQPKLVYMNVSVLKTLTDIQYFSGYGEIIKHGLIKDKEYFKWLKENTMLLKIRDTNTLEETIYRSCLIKKEVVEKDPTEKGDRALLNFGHTLGHAIEKLMNFTLLHGECVAIGMAAAAHLSYNKGYLTKEELTDILETIHEFELPTTVSNLDPNDIVKASKNDKKMEAGKIKFILLNGIGNAIIDDTITDEDMLKALSMIIK